MKLSFLVFFITSILNSMEIKEIEYLDKGHHVGELEFTRENPPKDFSFAYHFNLTEKTAEDVIKSACQESYNELVALHWHDKDNIEHAFDNITSIKLKQKQNIFKIKFYQKNAPVTQRLMNAMGLHFKKEFPNYEDIISAKISKRAKIIYALDSKKVTADSVKFKFKNAKTGAKAICVLSREPVERRWARFKKVENLNVNTNLNS